jgi:threonine/homoserine/homoserine lactone efflux protein
VELSVFIILFITAWVFAVTPGPGTLALLSISTSRGFESSMYFSVGAVLGDTMYLTLVIFSLDAMAEYIAPTMSFVRYFGAAYLVYLGVSQWRSGGISVEGKALKLSNARELTTGFLVSGTNPKVMIFYISVLPALIELTEVSVFYGIQIISTVGLAVMTGLIVISLLGKQLKQLISTPSMAKRVNRISGTVMIAIGLTLAFV